MRKVYLPLSIVCLLASFLLLPVVKAGSSASSNVDITTGNNAPVSVASSSSVELAANLLYDSLELSDIGLSREAMLYAYKGQQELARKGMLSRPDILTVVDFSQSSSKKRMYIIDTRNFEVLMNTYVAHGKNSGLTYAERFSNKLESLQSSLGFYVTKGTYFGKHGLSLKLSGKERGFNDNAETRAVVVHGAEYIGEQRAGAAYMGRSFGCPAVPQHQASKVINIIKNGTCLFVYHPSKSYLHGSKILNG
ncbi:MAG TPA: murein L,D-transpeptidase catalytic domain family protein [Flavisolibacter sp.]|nr:murein L,D-transpeptidase catalytic domain family protein [Flavisolibacter sp.]